jgi:hypothetical protein
MNNYVHFNDLIDFNLIEWSASIFAADWCMCSASSSSVSLIPWNSLLCSNARNRIHCAHLGCSSILHSSMDNPNFSVPCLKYHNLPLQRFLELHANLWWNCIQSCTDVSVNTAMLHYLISKTPIGMLSSEQVTLTCRKNRFRWINSWQSAPFSLPPWYAAAEKLYCSRRFSISAVTGRSIFLSLSIFFKIFFSSPTSFHLWVMPVSTHFLSSIIREIFGL